MPVVQAHIPAPPPDPPGPPIAGDGLGEVPSKPALPPPVVEVDPKLVLLPFALGGPHGPAPPHPIVTGTPDDGIGNDGNTFAPPATPTNPGARMSHF